MCTVGIQECTAQINDGPASPVHNQTRFFRNNSNRDCFQVLLACKAQECVYVLRIQNHCHTLLRLGDCDLSAIQTCIFLRNLVQINLKTCCQFTDRYGYTACAKVVTFLDDAAHFRTTEHSLDLTLGRSITFLNLCTADFDGSLRMYLRRTGSAADTVTAGTSAQQHDNIARIGIQTLYIFSRSSTHNSTDLHTFCSIIWMIDFFYIPGSQTDLVAVGAITACSTVNQLSLRQLALQSLIKRTGRISGTGHTHCLIYIGTTGKRITDCTAQTGSSAAERLDLSRMIVSFVFEVDQPLFSHTVDRNRNHDTAGVDLIRLLQIFQLALFTKLLHRHQRQIHQADKFVVTAFVDHFAVSQILIIGSFNRSLVCAIGDRHIFQFGGERSMTAVIGPVGIQYADLGHGRVAMLFGVIVILDMLEILEGHSQIQGAV